MTTGAPDPDEIVRATTSTASPDPGSATGSTPDTISDTAEGPDPISTPTSIPDSAPGPTTSPDLLPDQPPALNLAPAPASASVPATADAAVPFPDVLAAFRENPLSLLGRIPGVWLVDKPSGPSSNLAVVRARKRLGLKRVGHAGTLDPLASGLLLLLAGNATRLFDHM